MANKFNFNFLSKRLISLGLFAVVLVVGIVSYFANGVTLGTDFAGGIRIEFTVPENDIEKVRDLLVDGQEFQNSAFEQISVTTLRYSDGTEGYLLTAPTELSVGGSGDYLLTPLRSNYPSVVVLSSSYVGPSIGEDFALQSLRLLAIVAGLILVYVGFRFDLVYGVGSVSALVHDMTVLFVFTLLFKVPVDLTILAAFLTILGYSINDTIVIFDRIRENHELLPNEDFYKTVNKSINQSLKRTILTSVTTLFVAGAIFVWSGNALRNFGLLLIVGILSGTYSSIFVAAPVTYSLWKRTHEKPNKKVVKNN